MSSNSVVHFDELLRSKPQNVRALAAEHPCSGRKTSVLCPRNVRALPAERPCSVHRTSVLCPQNVRALSAERPCCVRRTSVLCPCTSVLSAAHPQSEWLAKLPIVVSERRNPNDSQDACRSNSRQFIRRSFSAILFMRCPWTLHEVSADASRITGLCCMHVPIPRKQVSYLYCTVR